MSWTPQEGRLGELWDEAVGGLGWRWRVVVWGGVGGGEPIGGRGSEGKGCGLQDLVGLLGSAVVSGGLLRTPG